jgi:hypothetical protein
MKRSRLAKFGRRKAREQNQGKRYGELADRVRAMPCCICGKPGPSHPHHVLTKGSGRKDRLPDGSSNLAPLCFNHHTGDEGVHTLGPETFARRFGVDLVSLAKELAE